MFDVESLQAAVRTGHEFSYLLFWGHKPRGDGRISTQCLSQWYASKFTVDGVDYPTAEHWMMAEKARLFGDAESEAKILASDDPNKAKGLGRRVSNFDPAIWDAHCYDIVLRGSVHKFSAHEAMTGFLLGTRDQVLVEASPMDLIWGIGVARDDPRATKPLEWPGRNLLGFALMEARAILRERMASGIAETK